jgi:pimeloyl-ACP methyl ester carboxylesterase
MRLVRVLAQVGLLCLVPPIGTVAVSETAAAALVSLRVGDLTLTSCSNPKTDAASAYCGRVIVPLDYAQPAGKKISVGFEWFPATSGDTASTIVGLDGGPGYSTISDSGQFLATFGPVLDHRNLLLFDLRGTGQSSPIICSALQKYTFGQPRADYLKDMAACGRQMGAASDDYTTAAATRDLVRILDALWLNKVDFYGLSYGSWFGQALADRYPQRLRSLTLDSTYPVLDADPLFLADAHAYGAAVGRVCARSAACADTGRSGARDLTALVDLVRTKPIIGSFADPTGAIQTRTVDVAAVLGLMNAADSNELVYHDLSAAADAVVRHHDPAPLIRLIVENLQVQDSGPVRAFSAGLYNAMICTDYPQPFDVHATDARRDAQVVAATDAVPPADTAPFTPREWVYSQPGPYDTQTLDSCRVWPAPASDPEPPLIHGAPLAPPDLPVLILSGDLDTTTSPADNRTAFKQLGPGNHRLITIPNTLHVAAATGSRENCGSVVVREFVTNPANLAQLDTTCAAEVPDVRALGTFPRTLANATPAVASSGRDIDSRLATVAAETAGDALNRRQDVGYYYQNTPQTSGVGLRGGGWKLAKNYPAGHTVLDLSAARWVNDVAVSGTVDSTDATGDVIATLTGSAPGSVKFHFTVNWNTKQPHNARATVRGSTNSGGLLTATLPAP